MPWNTNLCLLTQDARDQQLGTKRIPKFMWQLSHLLAYCVTYSRTLFWKASLSFMYSSAASMFRGSSKFSKSCNSNRKLIN